MLEVIKAKYVAEYLILITFNDGVSGVVDLKNDLWGPMFKPLKDLSTFQRFELSKVLHTIKWENDADLAPEYLYDKIVNQSTPKLQNS